MSDVATFMTGPVSPPATVDERAGVRLDVPVEGVRYSVRRAGPRRRRRIPALLLHGVPQTSLVWRPLMCELATDRVVLAPDLKGLGDSEVREPYDAVTVAGELAALVLHEVEGPVDVVGHDVGGSLALTLAAQRPDLIRRLVVVAAPYRHILRRTWQLPLFAVPGLAELAFRVGGTGLIGQLIRSGWRVGSPPDPDLLANYECAYADPRRVAAMVGYYQAFLRAGLAGGLRPHRAREGALGPRPRPAAALIIWGAKDPLVPLPVGESVVTDLGPAAAMVTLPGVGHWPLDEAPEVVVPAVAGFLRHGDPLAADPAAGARSRRRAERASPLASG